MHSIERIREQTSHRALLALKRARQAILPAPGTDKVVVFVAGVQRSGTNMLMDILERSMETDVYHERDPRAFLDYQMREKDTINRLYRASRARFFVIKCLCELQDLRALLDSMAPARAFWIVRRYADVVNSMRKSFPKLARVPHRIAADRNFDWWIARGISDETHALLKSLVHDDMTDASSLALVWYLRNVLFFEQSLDRDHRVHLLGYERLVSDPEGTMRVIYDAIPLEPSARLVSKVFSASVRKQPEPDIEPAVREICDALHERLRDIMPA